MTTETIKVPIPDGIEFGAQDMGQRETDITFEEVASLTPGLPEILPAQYNMPYKYISNQGDTPDCTAHSQAGVVNQNNGLEAGKLGAVPDAKLINPVWLGEFGHQIGKITANGGFINWAFPYFIRWKYISGYTVVGRSVDEIKRAILRNGAINTGSNSITWSEFLPGWVAKYIPNSPGHAFRIFGWDDSRRVFFIANSWGEDWGDGGCFYISYDDISLLYTLYVFHDVDDTSALLRAKAKKIGVWNGMDENVVATRKEAIIIAYRIAGRVGSDYDHLANAKLKKVYDGTRDDDKVTLFEAKLIWERLGIKKTPMGVTRGELVETIS